MYSATITMQKCQIIRTNYEIIQRDAQQTKKTKKEGESKIETYTLQTHNVIKHCIGVQDCENWYLILTKQEEEEEEAEGREEGEEEQRNKKEEIDRLVRCGVKCVQSALKVRWKYVGNALRRPAQTNFPTPNFTARKKTHAPINANRKWEI